MLLGLANVEVETNDPNLFPFLVSATGDVEDASSFGSGAIDDPSVCSCRWKIIRDVDVRGKTNEPTVVVAGELMVYTAGPACLIAADRGRREILGFVGRDVDKSALRESILPAIVRLTEFVARFEEPASILESFEASSSAACHA